MKLWQMKAADRLAWMQGREEIQVEPHAGECPHCDGTVRYRYKGPSADYDNNHEAFPTAWYHQCGYAIGDDGAVWAG